MTKFGSMNCGLLASLALLVSGCASQYTQSIEDFRDYQDQGDYERARALMTEEPHRWWSKREGEGSPWTIGGAKGRWSAWDEHFSSTAEYGAWETGDGWARRVVTEMNEYYGLTERGPQPNLQTWWFDEQGLIEGWSIEAIRGDSSYGRADEFEQWAMRTHPDEMAYLRPGGKIDPTEDRAPRTRALLNAWREEVGLDQLW